MMAIKPTHQIFTKTIDENVFEIFIFDIGISEEQARKGIDGIDQTSNQKEFKRQEIETTDYMLTDQQRSVFDPAGVNSMGGKLPYRQINRVSQKELDAIINSKKIENEKFSY